MARINTVKNAAQVEAGVEAEAENNVVTITPPVAEAPSPAVQVFDTLELPESVRSGGKSKYPWASTKIGGGFFVPDGDVKTFYTMCSSQTKKSKDAKFVARKWTGEGGVEGVMVFKRPKD